MQIAQSQLVHKDRTEGKTAGGYQAACEHLAMALEDPFELLMEILNRYRAGFRPRMSEAVTSGNVVVALIYSATCERQ
jgi:hypothetical protein